MRILNVLLVAAWLAACLGQAWAQQHSHSAPAAVAQASPASSQAPQAPPSPAAAPGVMAHGDMHAPTIFTLRSGIALGRMVYIGVGGDIDGAVNPSLTVHEGETV